MRIELPFCYSSSHLRMLQRAPTARSSMTLPIVCLLQ